MLNWVTGLVGFWEGDAWVKLERFLCCWRKPEDSGRKAGWWVGRLWWRWRRVELRVPLRFGDLAWVEEWWKQGGEVWQKQGEVDWEGRIGACWWSGGDWRRQWGWRRRWWELLEREQCQPLKRRGKWRKRGDEGDWGRRQWESRCCWRVGCLVSCVVEAGHRVAGVNSSDTKGSCKSESGNWCKCGEKIYLEARWCGVHAPLASIDNPEELQHES